MLQKAVGSFVFVCRYVCEFEVKKQDCRDPVVDHHIGLYVGVVEHSSNELHIHFDHEPADADEVKVEHLECLK